MKRLLITGTVVLAVTAVGLVLATRQAARFAEARITPALDPSVTLTGVGWAWPAGLHVRQVTVAGTGEFAGTDALVAERVTIRIRPLAFVRGKVDVSSVVVGNLLVTVRKHQNALIHPLSGLAAGAAGASSGEGSVSRWTTRVGDLRVENGTARFIDHDLAPGPFEAAVSALRATARTDARGGIRYDVSGQLEQGADYPPGRVALTVTTDADTGETDAELEAEGVAIPAFRAYIPPTTPMPVESGFVALRSRTDIDVTGSIWLTHVRLDLTGLDIAGDGRGGRPAAGLAGLAPMSLIGLFSDPSGAVSLDVWFVWDREFPRMTFQGQLTEGIHRAVRAKVAASVPSGLGDLLRALDGPGRGGPSGGQRSPLEALLEGLGSPGR